MLSLKVLSSQNDETLADQLTGIGGAWTVGSHF